MDDVKPPERPQSEDGPPPTPPENEPAHQTDGLPAEQGKQLPAKTKTGRFHSFKLKLSKLSRKQWAILITVLVLLLGSGGAGAYYLYKKFRKLPPVAEEPAVKVEKPPEPTTLPSPLTGVEVEPALAKRPVTGVMIENSPDARPQAGLVDAGVVFEAIAEGGITRFLALFQESQPEHIGPVRSARPYYLDWALSFDASYAHVGGSPEALSLIKSLGVKDLDQFSNSGAFQRVSNRFAPHNMYTSMAKLDALNQAKGFTASTFTPFPRKKDAPSATPTAKAIDLNISSANYKVHYDYDPATNTYARVMGGKPHTDERSGAQIKPKVVIALVMQQGLHADRQHTTYNTVGNGKVYIFQDGIVYEGTWQKADHKAQITFTDAAGNVFSFNPGQTWITAVGSADRVTFAP